MGEEQRWEEINKEHVQIAAAANPDAADEPAAVIEGYDAWRNPIAFAAADTFTLFSALGDVSGRAALDLACGPGFNTRLLAQNGARPVVGVDFSEEIIKLARMQEEAHPLGIDYRVADVSDMPVLGRFEVATAAYLFNLTPSRAALGAMFRNIHANLADDGRLVAIVANPVPSPRPNWEEFGLRIRERVTDGEAPLLRVDILTEQPMPLEFYEWHGSDLVTAAQDAGFVAVDLQPNRTPEPDQHRGEDFWHRYAQAPISSLLTCVKRG